ncbi:MAG: hypothetical protein FWD66_02245 [Paludibacter sp.]|nr:hypothetical protein [Paludibacter sp.]
MKLKIFAIIIVFLCIPILCVAQSKNDSIIKKSVTVERDFVPEIQPAGKIDSPPTVVEPQKAVLDAVYSDFTSPLSLGGNIHPLSAATLLYSYRVSDRPGFARLAVGYYPNSVADFAYPLIDRSDMRLDAVVKQRGTYNDKYSMITTAQLNFDKYYDNLTLFGGFDAGYQGIKYYGMNFNRAAEELYFSRLIKDDENVTYTALDFPSNNVKINDLDQATQFAHFFRIGANLGVHSAQNAENWRYLARLKYGLFRNTAGVTEHFLNTSGQISFIFNENRIGVDAELYNVFYNSNEKIDFSKNSAVLALSPYFEFNQLEDFNIRLGILAVIPFAGGSGFKIAPDVRLEWNAIPKNLKIYAGLTGKYKTNSMSDIFYENPYLAPEVRVKDTFTPMDFYAGLLVKPISGLLFDVFADYSIINNDYFFVNKSYLYSQGNVYQFTESDRTIFSNRFCAVYDRSNLLTIGGRASYTLKDIFNIDFSGKHFSGPLKNEQFPWQRPTWDFTLNASYKVVKDVNISLTGYYQNGIMAKLGSVAVPMKNRLDLNLGVAYTYSQWLTLFLTGNNLLNSKYDIYYGYQVQGINVMIGTVMSF